MLSRRVPQRNSHSQGPLGDQLTSGPLPQRPRGAPESEGPPARRPHSGLRPPEPASAGISFVPGPEAPEPAPPAPGDALRRLRSRRPERPRSAVRRVEIEAPRRSAPAASPMLALSGLDFRPSICARTTLDHRDYASTLLLARCRRQHYARMPATHPARSSRLVQVLSTRLDDAARAELRRSGCSSSSWAGRWLPVRPEPAAGQPRRLCPPRSCSAARRGRSRARRRAPRAPAGAAGRTCSCCCCWATGVLGRAAARAAVRSACVVAPL